MRAFIFFLLIVLAPVLASLYGFIHDQITYSISEEFFTKFRFLNLNYEVPPEWHDRMKAGYTGIMNAWRPGLLMGIIITLVGLIHRSDFQFFMYTLYAFLTVFFMAFLFSFGASLMYGDEVEIIQSLTLPPDILFPLDFQKVERINNFGYVGGIIGMFLGVGLHLFMFKKNRNKVPAGTPKA